MQAGREPEHAAQQAEQDGVMSARERAILYELGGLHVCTELLKKQRKSRRRFIRGDLYNNIGDRLHPGRQK